MVIFYSYVSLPGRVNPQEISLPSSYRYIDPEASPWVWSWDPRRRAGGKIACPTSLKIYIVNIEDRYIYIYMYIYIYHIFISYMYIFIYWYHIYIYICIHRIYIYIYIHILICRYVRHFEILFDIPWYVGKKNLSWDSMISGFYPYQLGW